MSLGVGLDEYAQQVSAGGFGTGQASDMDDLMKAMSAGSQTGRELTDSLTASGAPLKVESLEKTLKVIQFKESDIVLWKNIPKLPAFNTVEEYNRLESYGNDRGGFNLEGELPDEEDSVYSRRAQIVKFLGTTRSVTHPMTLVRTNIGDMVQREVQNGTLWILRKANYGLIRGDSDLVPAEWNGLYKQHQEGLSTPLAYYGTTASPNKLVVDLRGAAMSEDVMEQAAQTIVDNYGSIDTFFAPPIVLSNFTKTFYQFKRQMMPIPGSTTVGARVTSFQSQFGEIGLNFDKFMNRLPTKTTTSTATSDKAPTAPTPDGSTPIAAVGSDASAKWAAGDAGNYLYAVTAINRYGESALAVLSGSATTIAAGGAVDLKWASGGGTYTATAYRIYRSTKGASSASGTTFYPLFEVSSAQLTAGYDGAAAGLVRDRNHILPGTDQAFACDMDEQILSFKQLAPLMKMDLARLAPSIRFMILLYGTPILYQPSKFIRFINIGTA